MVGNYPNTWFIKIMKYQVGTLLKEERANFKSIYEIINIKDGKYVFINIISKNIAFDYINLVDKECFYEPITNEDKLELL